MKRTVIIHKHYSPTVSYSYRIHPDWWNENHNPESSDKDYDCEGFDEYGYNKNGRDRAWNRESDYNNNQVLYEETKKDFQFLFRRTLMV